MSQGEKKRGTEDRLGSLLRRRRVMSLAEICEALGGVSRATAHRRLREVGYRTSYNHNGRYYTADESSKWDQGGLWSHKGIRFSRDGSLTATVRRLVEESERGRTQRELQQVLGVRVQNVLSTLLERDELKRSRVGGTYVYLATDEQTRHQQLSRRSEQEATQQHAPLAAVVDVLLVLIRHPGSDPSAVSRRLRGRSPPVSIEQIRWVFDRYELGQKRGLSTS